MKTQMQIEIIGAERFDINGNKIAKMYLLQDADSTNPNTVGRSVMGAKCDYDLLDKMQGLSYPCKIQASVKVVMGKGKATTLQIEDVEVPPQHSAKKAA